MTHFYIGCSPSEASKVIDQQVSSGCMISVNRLRQRKSNFSVKNWILDSGAFTEISKYGQFRFSAEEYVNQVNRWSLCGRLLCAVSQDWMCEDFVLNRTGLSIEQHQRLTIQRYDQILALKPQAPIMPVLQGYQISDYIRHLFDYGDRLKASQWVGIGSVCRRNRNPSEIIDIFRSIKLVRPDLRLHGFGIKKTVLSSDLNVDSLIYSCDSMAWSYSRKFTPVNDSVQNRSPVQDAHKYQQELKKSRSVPRTAGAGNGQGRKSKWNNPPSVAIRVPVVFAEEILSLAQLWDADPRRKQTSSCDRTEYLEE